MSRELKNPYRIAVRAVAYRTGVIEVVPNIHPGCVNLETWWVDPDLVPAEIELGSVSLPPGAILANAELELRADEARQLIRLLQDAVEAVEQPAGVSATPDHTD